MNAGFNLYLLTIRRGSYSCYVIAEDPLKAQVKLEELLNKADWWYSADRKVIKIELLAENLRYYPENKPNFPGELNCVIDAR